MLQFATSVAQTSNLVSIDREHPDGVFVESTAVSVSAALALSAFYTFFKPVLNLQNSRPICAQVELPLKESSAAVSTAKAHCDEDESAAVTYYTASVIASPVTVLEPKEEKGIAICPSQKWLSLFFKDFQTQLKILT